LRINALLKRSGVVHHYQRNDIMLDFHAHRAMKKNKEVHLAPKEREVLRTLAEHPGIVCTRTDLLELIR
jgi:DNA-binding response OmpR family regulator